MTRGQMQLLLKKRSNDLGRTDGFSWESYESQGADIIMDDLFGSTDVATIDLGRNGECQLWKNLKNLSNYVIGHGCLISTKLVNLVMSLLVKAMLEKSFFQLVDIIIIMDQNSCQNLKEMYIVKRV